MSPTYITNNPLIEKNLSYHHNIEFYDTDYIKILELTRDKIHLGYKLLTHPLSSSIKPNETPYKTTILSDKCTYLDLNSLYIIENSIQTAKKFLRDKDLSHWDQNTLYDFQLIDLRLFLREENP